MKNLKAKIISLSGSWKARAIAENDNLFLETSEILMELADQLEDDDEIPCKKVETKNPFEYPNDFYNLHRDNNGDKKNKIIEWTGYPYGAIVCSSVKHEILHDDGSRVVTSFSGAKYNVHNSVRECGGSPVGFYIREACYPIRWEIKND